MVTESEDNMDLMTVTIVRRIGAAPRVRNCSQEWNCPDIFELSDGQFAVIGTDRTEELEKLLPDDAGRADYERIVVITRETLVRARPDIPQN
jgi:hypothetical protein